MKPFLMPLVLIASACICSSAASQSTPKKTTKKSSESATTAKKDLQPAEAPESVKFALECTQNTNSNNKRYFVQSTKSAYSTNGKEGVSRPILYATEDSRYVYTDVATHSGSTFDYEIQINRQTLNMTMFTDMRGDAKKEFSFTSRYTCVQIEGEVGMNLVNDLMAKEIAKEDAKKKELLDNQKL